MHLPLHHITSQSAFAPRSIDCLPPGPSVPAVSADEVTPDLAVPAVHLLCSSRHRLTSSADAQRAHLLSAHSSRHDGHPSRKSESSLLPKCPFPGRFLLLIGSRRFGFAHASRSINSHLIAVAFAATDLSSYFPQEYIRRSRCFRFCLYHIKLG